MRVLMFGWEFPPHMSGGLGTACYGMTRALTQKGTEVLFVLPRLSNSGSGKRKEKLSSKMDLLSASGTMVEFAKFYPVFSEKAKAYWEEKLQIRTIESLLFPYATPESYLEHLRELEYKQSQERIFGQASEQSSYTLELNGGYGPDLMSEVYRYSEAAASIANEEEFTVIHAHDWMTYPAGIVAREVSGKPLVVHIHATEFDRSGIHINQEVAAIEREGMLAADKVIAVSYYTKELIMARYGIPEEKIEVVHNAVAKQDSPVQYPVPHAMEDEKQVLFMGRVTFQKGPDYFVEAAHLVLKKMPNVRFIMAGSGDMLSRMVRRVAQLRMGHRFHFTGFLRGSLVDKMYALSDLYVMPSVSEPFGIAPLEAMIYDKPVLISKQSGVAEVVQNALKVDFWDVQEMANKICAVLAYPKLSAEMIKNCREELKEIKWEKAAELLNSIYNDVTQRR